MKKILIVFQILLLFVSAMAQTNNELERTSIISDSDFGILPGNYNQNRSSDIRTVSRTWMLNHSNASRVGTGITKTYIGTSANVYSVYMPEQTCLTANEETGLIMMTHRADGTTLGSGNILCSFSLDSGHVFNSSSLVIWQNVWGNSARYPGGVIYNPSGNTNPLNAYAVSAGPILDAGSSVWVGGYFSSATFGITNANHSTTFYTTDTAGGTGQLNTMPRMHMQSRGGNIFLYGNANTDNGTNYTSFKTVVNIGTWNSGLNKFDWIRVPHTPGYIVNYLGYPDGLTNPGFAMADDGLTGYLVYCGRDSMSADQLSYIPLIYKTTNGGLSWVKQAAFDWTTIPALQTFVAGFSNVLRPRYTTISDAAIDANGRLHFTSFIYGAYSNHPDSLQYYSLIPYIKGFVFDTYQTATGWDAMIVDTVYASDADEYYTIIDPGTSNAVALNERFQISRTADGSKLFYAWLDTDTLFSEYNIYPDIHVKMYDVATGTMGPDNNLTAGTDYDAFNYWLCLSDFAFDLDTIYQLNMSTSTLNTNAAGPVDHEYVNNVYLDDNGYLLAVPTAPTAVSYIQYCQNSAATPLTATGTNLKWYTTAIGGTGSTIAPTPGTATPGDQYFFVSQTVNGFESPRAQITVHVNAIPPTPVISQNVNTLISDATTGNQWFDDNGPISGAVSQFYIVTANGNYFVVVSSNGCYSDTSNVISITGVGINENEMTFSIYPNPATGRISLNGIEPGGMIRLYDVAGKQLLELENKNNSLDLSGISSGCYILEIHHANEVLRSRLVVE